MQRNGPNALLAFNTTKQNSTGKSPFYLLHGYEPCLPRGFHIASFINDMPREDQLDLLMLARAEAENYVHETHLSNKRRFDLHPAHTHFKKEISYYTTGRNKEIINYLQFSRAICDCSPSRGRVLRDQVYDTG
ncbi:uncharacterized protein TNCT_683701 [Trichonephila clavata]|uniref:Uncharacterized protein n=1 Tax=Trichonephila clavata TaxID=2740835 RepID=A0A8X6F375_TRICU|nr:uncharacterized protein TNCT_683701 [Trichonephila clavata]